MAREQHARLVMDVSWTNNHASLSGKRVRESEHFVQYINRHFVKVVKIVEVWFKTANWVKMAEEIDAKDPTCILNDCLSVDVALLFSLLLLFSGCNQR